MRPHARPYMGDALLQKKYTTDTLPFRRKENRGECPQYYVENANPTSRAVSDEAEGSRQEGRGQLRRNTDLLRLPK